MTIVPFGMTWTLYYSVHYKKTLEGFCDYNWDPVNVNKCLAIGNDALDITVSNINSNITVLKIPLESSLVHWLL